MTFVLMLVVSMSGCATAVARIELGPPNTVYPATVMDCGYLKAMATDGCVFQGQVVWWARPVIFAVFLVDLPISLVADTLCLPFDISRDKDTGTLE